MKRKLKIKKFWIAILTDILAITMIFFGIGGSAGIIATIFASIITLIIIILTHKKTDYFSNNKKK